MHLKVILILATSAITLIGCSNNFESMKQEYESECFASGTTKCVTLRTDLELLKANHVLSSIRNEKKQQILADLGREGYRDLLTSLRRDIFDLEIERPSWVSRTFQANDDYNSGASKGELMMKSYEISKEKANWGKIVAEIDKEMESIPDVPAPKQALSDAVKDSDETNFEPVNQNEISQATPEEYQPNNLTSTSPENLSSNSISTPPEVVDEVSSNTINPSFDCNKASRPSEHMICSDNELASLDAKLSNAYSRLRAVSLDNAQLKKQQTAWMRNERDVCNDLECVKTAYRNRISKIESEYAESY